jgi:hypothetical protein
MRLIAIRAFCAATVLVMLIAGAASRLFAQAAPTLTVDAGSVRQAINPDIYGMLGGGNQLDPTLAATLKTPNVRWGGDAASRYNWNNNSTCDGNDDWFVCQLFGSGTTPGYVVDNMVSTYRAAYSGTHILVTIPILPWIDSSNAELCSYPVSVYGAQQAQITIGTGQVCGNGVSTGGTNIIDTNITYDMVANSTAVQTNWLNHLVSKWGTAANGGVNYYQLDNEPGGWANTHRDAIPTTQTYDVISSLGEQYATAIKTVDPTAKVLGPSDYGEWGWVLNAPSGSNLLAGQYYLQQFAAYDAAHGSRSLDCFDEHYGVGDPSSAAASFNQVRTFWDPSYTTTGDFVYLLTGASPAPIMMIPRFQGWVATYYPNTPVCMSEYEVQHTGNTLVDALVVSDALGVFGYYGLQLANLYDTVNSADPEAYAFRMYRNYDGSGNQFGDTSITSVSTDQTQLSVYGAVRSSDKALTIMVVNKTTAAIQTSLSVANFASTGTAAVYTYSGTNLNQITAGSPVAVVSNEVQYSFPSYSATLFVLTSGIGAPPAPPTGLTAVVH